MAEAAESGGPVEHRISFEANPTQKLFIESRAEADYFSCRMGEGKSAALCWAIWYHTKHNPGANWALIRDTFENLQRTTMQEFFTWFPPGLLGIYKAGEKKFIWNGQGMKGTVAFLGMDDEKDAGTLQSMSLAGFAIDEPAPAAEGGGVSEMIFDTAMTRLRQKGMKWYAAKLAANNPDETHWTYRRFKDPGDDGTDAKVKILPDQERGYRIYQTTTPENKANLPPGYYERTMNALRNRPDLQRRFVLGQFGFQQSGKAVTPGWSDPVHLVEDGIDTLKGVPLVLLWDFGLNPTCIITQVSPLGQWLALESHVGDGIGAYELIEQVVKPRLTDGFKGYEWRHIGDPAGTTREQSSSEVSAVKVIRKELGGRWTPGPSTLAERIDPLEAVLTRLVGGTGMLQVDKQRAKEVYMALRGGWHYNVSRGGIASTSPVKDRHSHPGDAMGYGAAVLFPLGRLQLPRRQARQPRKAQYFGNLGFERPGLRLPEAMHTIAPSDEKE